MIIPQGYPLFAIVKFDSFDNETKGCWRYWSPDDISSVVIVGWDYDPEVEGPPSPVASGMDSGDFSGGKLYSRVRWELMETLETAGTRAAEERKTAREYWEVHDKCENGKCLAEGLSQ